MGQEGLKDSGKGIWFPLLKKALGGVAGRDSRDSHSPPQPRPPPRSSAGFLAGAPGRAVPGLHMDPVYVAGLDAILSGTTSQEASDCMQASGQGSLRAVQM